MASYDSDSSGDEEEYTETNVLLGYASKDPTDDDFSQLGGYPTWLNDQAPSFSLAKCKVCSDPMTLLLQLNGDLPQTFAGHSRRLYIFSCRRKTCRRKPGCVRGFRATRVSASALKAQRKHEVDEAAAAAEALKRKEKDEEDRRKQGSLGTALFGGGAPPVSSNANPFAAPLSSTSPANRFASASSLAAKPAQKTTSTNDTDAALSQTFAEKARLSSPPPADSPVVPTTTAAAEPHVPWPSNPQSALPSPYPSYHLDADYEALDPTPPAIPGNAVLDPDAAEPTPEASGSGGETNVKEAFESSLDKAFQRFADRLAQNPEQVLRYEWGGVPLLCSRDDDVGKLFGAGADEEGDHKVTASGGGAGIPRCGNCSAERVFEVQLVPQAIMELEAEELSLEGMEWATIIMGTCKKDCAARGTKDSEVGYVEEWVGVQWEELAARK
ncbi:programmed cell death protein 2 [Phyllosticta citriasiana]|uniref:Programmed cell death protein 2 n=1 Tax=Phyllosticta citriasiana TaxID=595635 RepID=A0ABR1KTK3_9PEZI